MFLFGIGLVLSILIIGWVFINIWLFIIQYYKDEEGMKYRAFFTSVSFLALLIIILTGIFFYELGKKDGNAETLKNQNKYKMEVTYELKDSIYTPVDTIFIKK
jgi:amino acid permease